MNLKDLMRSIVREGYCIPFPDFYLVLHDLQYGIMIVELVIRELRIDEVVGRGGSDSRMTSVEVIMPLKLKSTNMYIHMCIYMYMDVCV